MNHAKRLKHKRYMKLVNQLLRESKTTRKLYQQLRMQSSILERPVGGSLLRLGNSDFTFLKHINKDSIVSLKMRVNQKGIAEVGIFY